MIKVINPDEINPFLREVKRCSFPMRSADSMIQSQLSLISSGLKGRDEKIIEVHLAKKVTLLRRTSLM
jgi:hypothetical protein